MTERLNDEGQAQVTAGQGDGPRQSRLLGEEKPQKGLTPTFDWVLGILFAGTGFIGLFIRPKAALLMLVMAAILLPPATQFIESRLKFKLSRPIKLFVIAGCMYLFTKLPR